MVITTKTLRYTISKGRNVNSVNATIISATGCNPLYFGKLPGILKILELVLACISLGLIGSMRIAGHFGISFDDDRMTPMVENATDLAGDSYLHGEVSFLCAHTAVLVTLVVFFITYVFDTVSSMIIPKVSSVEIIANFLFSLLCIASGVTEITFTVFSESNYFTFPWVEGKDNIVRFAAGSLALLNGVLFFISFIIARRELAGPRQKNSGL